MNVSQAMIYTKVVSIFPREYSTAHAMFVLNAFGCGEI